MTHHDWMKRALKLARKGRTSPNPKVGAVLVKDGVLVGQGFHLRAGEPHAEVMAVRDAGEQARGAVMYVTLEPCCHTGRTPPCTQAIISAGIRRVYMAMLDPDTNVAGRGMQKLRSAGVEVECGLMEREATELNAAYIKHRVSAMPLVTLKLAMSLDGKIATHSGDSKWITGEKARSFVHKIRAEVDAVVVGAGTAVQDDPLLTARVGRSVRYPTRVVVAGRSAIPRELRMFSEPGETIVAVPDCVDAAALDALRGAGSRIVSCGTGDRVSLACLMRELAALGHLSVLMEGGAELAASALDEQIVDRVLFFYAPLIIGGRSAVPGVGGVGVEAVRNAVRIEQMKTRRFGPDLAIEGRVAYSDTA